MNHKGVCRTAPATPGLLHIILLVFARSDVIRVNATNPEKTCDFGWTYDNSVVFETITSEVRCVQN